MVRGELKDRDISADEVDQRSICMLDLSAARVFETAVDALDVGVYLVDRHRKIVYWNRGAERVAQVRDYADQRLRKPDMPDDASNRRVSVIVQYITKDAGM